MRASILVAARGLIQRYGLRKTTMEDIAHAMGKQKSFLYYYYPGKQELMSALAEDSFSQISRAVRNDVERQTDAASRLRTCLVSRVRHEAAEAGIYSLTLPDLRSGGEGSVDFFRIHEQKRAFDEAEERYFAGILRRGVRDGQIRPLPERSILAFSHFVFAAVRGIELELILDFRQTKDPMPWLENSCDVFLRGLVS
jgi:AcrR family transcriptional regulator